MLSDDQILDELQRALAAETSGMEPRPGLLGRVHQELAAAPARRRRARRPRLHAGAIVMALSVGVTVGVAVVALVFLHHSNNPNPAPATRPGGVAARAPDPHGGLMWGLRLSQPRPRWACLQFGRVQSGEIGWLGQDGAFGNDGRFHPIPPQTSWHCGHTDTHGHLFFNVLVGGVPASAAVGKVTGCQIRQPRLPPGVPRGRVHRHRLPTCPKRDLRSIAFGVLGPDAVSVTYSLDHHTVTERTGPDGAYLAVVPWTGELCTFGPPGGGERCFGGSGAVGTHSPILQAGIITSVKYRDGHVCRLETTTSGGVGSASCPNVGQAPYPPYRPPHITEAQVRAPITVRVFTAKRYCYKRLSGGFVTPCDHGTPPGYKPARWMSRSIALVDISFTARLAADNHHSVYEYYYGRSSGPRNCPLNTGGTSGTTMVPIRAGQRLTIQDDQEVCPGRFTGVVTYQPDGGPGNDTLGNPNHIFDHSILVGRFSYTLRKR